MATPNVYADSIEWMVRHLDRRESVVVSLHPHNDRGTGVAAAELGYLAGADRIEGCLFGNGERTGNVDLVTLGMNLFSQGIDPQIDFSDIDEIRRTVEYCNQLPVHERTPGAATSSSRPSPARTRTPSRRASRRWTAEAKAQGTSIDDLVWGVPYLPIDPHDLGRSYEAVVRVNSQSGKGGVAYLLKTEHALDLPRRLQIEFSGVVQRRDRRRGRRGRASRALGDLPGRVPARPTSPTTLGPLRARSTLVTDRPSTASSTIEADHRATAARSSTVTGTGNGPIAAFIDALATVEGVDVRVLDYVEHALSAGGDARAAAYVECAVGERVLWGVGIDAVDRHGLAQGDRLGRQPRRARRRPEGLTDGPDGRLI